MKRIAVGAVLLATTVGVALPAAAKPARAAMPSAHHGFGLRVPTHPANRPAQRPRVAATPTPTAVDLTPWTVPVGNQGRLNSCVAWVVDYAMVGWYSRREGRPGQPFAPMYAYSQIQTMHGWSDGGAFVEDGLQIADEQGVDTLSDYPQGNYDWRTQPTSAQREHAAGYRTQGSHFLYQSWTQPAGAGARAAIQSAVASGHPVAMSIPVYAAFDELSATSGPLTAADVAGAPLLGYHEVLAVGYDATGVRIQNSWGTGWGDGGFATLAWDYVEQNVGDASVMDGFADNSSVAPAVGSVAPANGPVSGGTPVTVRGLGFLGAKAVVFGTTAAASFTVLDDTTIVTTAPALPSADAVQVRVSSNAGTSTTAATYGVAAPHATSLLPARGAAGGGAVITVSGSALRQVTSATVGGVPVSSLQVVDDSVLRMTAPAHAAGSSRVRLVVGSASFDVGAFRYVGRPQISRIVRISARVVALRGSNLGPAPTVKFGHRVARVITASANAVRVLVPSSKGRVQVRVLTVFGVSTPKRFAAAPR